MLIEQLLNQSKIDLVVSVMLVDHSLVDRARATEEDRARHGLMWHAAQRVVEEADGVIVGRHGCMCRLTWLLVVMCIRRRNEGNRVDLWFGAGPMEVRGGCLPRDLKRLAVALLFCGRRSSASCALLL